MAMLIKFKHFSTIIDCIFNVSIC